MANEKEITRDRKDKETGDLSATEQQENSTMKVEPEKEKPKIANPDEEDPRLYSPLQEPDSPLVEERATEKPSEEDPAPTDG